MLQEEKNYYRKKYLYIRKNIKDKEFKSNQILKKIINTKEFKNAITIGIYNSLISEVDTKKLIEYSLSIGKIVGLPKVEDKEIRFYRIDALNEELMMSNFGVEEPIGDMDKYIVKDNIDLVIVPGICFDKEGNRLGFGKGYYDRFLDKTKLNTIGICFEEQITNEVPTDANDIKMGKIITDKDIYF